MTGFRRTNSPRPGAVFRDVRHIRVVNLAIASCCAVCMASVFPFSSAGARAALAPVTIHLGAAGPDPITAHLTAGLHAPSWLNETDQAQSVSFTNGLCSITVAAGSRATCQTAFWRYVGRYRYDTNGYSGMLVVDPASRSVDLTASPRRSRSLSRVTLSGELDYTVYLGLPAPQPVVVFARAEGVRQFARIALIKTRLVDEKLLWTLSVRPRRTTTYVVQASWQPAGGQVWANARSVPVTVRVVR